MILGFLLLQSVLIIPSTARVANFPSSVQSADATRQSPARNSSNPPSTPPLAGSSQPSPFRYDEQLGLTFAQNVTSIEYNVTAVEQADPTLGNGPAYLLSGLSNTGYWFQIGLSWNWAPGQNPGIGFDMNYEVFAPNGSSIFPTKGGTGLLSLYGLVNRDDSVLLTAQFTNSEKVVMIVKDLRTGASYSETFGAEGGTYFVGLPYTISNPNGFFTGLMTEWYHQAPYYGQEQKVEYTNAKSGLSSAWMWIDELDTQTHQALFATQTPGLVSYTSNPKLQVLASHSATVYSNAHELITGSLNVALVLNYSTYRGGLGYSPPMLTYVSDGTQMTVALSTMSTAYFLDNGTKWSVTSLLAGSTLTDRWMTNQPTNGTARVSEEIGFIYYSQYYVTFNYEVIGGGSGYSPPIVTYFLFGSPASTLVGVGVWADSGSYYNQTDPLVGSTPNERWSAGSFGQIGFSHAVQITYLREYWTRFNISFVGGFPKGLVFQYSSPRGTSGYGLDGPGAVAGWADANSTWSITLPQDSNERWVNVNSSVGTTGVVNHPIEISLLFQHQYYEIVMPNLAAGGSVSLSSGWYDAGTNLTARATVNPGWMFEGWNGTGSGSQSSSNDTILFIAGKSLGETAIFYSGLNITAMGSVNVSYVFGTRSGTVPAGTSSEVFVDPSAKLMLSATPESLLYSFDRWSGANTSTMSTILLLVKAPESITATSTFNYLAIGTGIVALALAAVVIALAVTKRRATNPKTSEGSDTVAR